MATRIHFVSSISKGYYVDDNYHGRYRFSIKFGYWDKDYIHYRSIISWWF